MQKYYNSFTDYCKNTFQRKLYRVALDANMTCPNRDGRIDHRGCIFCDEGGSGDFAIKYTGQSLTKEDLIYNHQDADAGDYIAYFQAYTNTYAPVETLEHLFTSALKDPLFCGLLIATRPDCIHVILGLPNETKQDMIETIQYLNTKKIFGIKLQLLHYLKGCDLGRVYEKDPSLFHVLSLEEYIDIITDCIGYLDENIVIHRLTGDGASDLLLAPLWSMNKRHVLNQILHTLKIKNIQQGSFIHKCV